MPQQLEVKTAHEVVKPYGAGDMSDRVWVTVDRSIDGVLMDSFGFYLARNLSVAEATRLLKKRLRGALVNVLQTDETPQFKKQVLDWPGIGVKVTGPE